MTYFFARNLASAAQRFRKKSKTGAFLGLRTELSPLIFPINFNFIILIGSLRFISTYM